MYKNVFNGYRMRKLSRLVSIILVAFMTASILGACRKDNGKNNADTSTGTVKKSADATTAKKAAQSVTNARTDSTAKVEEPGKNVSEPTEAETPSEVAPVSSIDVIPTEDGLRVNIDDIEVTVDGNFIKDNIDLGGRTIIWAAWGTDDVPSDALDASPEQTFRYLRIKDAEKKYNFKMEYKTGLEWSQYVSQILSHTMAGIKFADVVKTQGIMSIPNHVVNNIIIPLDDYIDYENPLLKKNAYLYNGSLWKGKHYGITFITTIYTSGVMFNKDLLGREGQPDIMDLVEAKQWNWDAFLEIAKNCTKDTDGDGKIDQFGVVTPGGFKRGLGQRILYSNGIGAGIDFVDGKPTYILDTPPAQRALQFMSELCHYYKVWAQENSNASKYYKVGKAAMYIDGSSYHTSILNAGLNSGFAPLPMGPDVDNYQCIYSGNFDAILSTCDIPKEVAQIWMEVNLFWDENLEPLEKLKELRSRYPYDWEWSPSNPNRRYSTEREYRLSFIEVSKNFKLDIGLGYPSAEYTEKILWEMVCNPIMNGVMSPAQAVDTSKNAAQSIIDMYEK